jgi:hypothetical protein
MLQISSKNHWASSKFTWKFLEVQNQLYWNQVGKSQEGLLWHILLQSDGHSTLLHTVWPLKSIMTNVWEILCTSNTDNKCFFDDKYALKIISISLFFNLFSCCVLCFSLNLLNCSLCLSLFLSPSLSCFYLSKGSFLQDVCFLFLYARLQMGRIMLWRCLSGVRCPASVRVCPSHNSWSSS